MDAFKTHGAFSWSELTTTDPEAAVTFYADLFGWTLDKMDMGMPYHVIKVGDAAIGGIAGMPPGVPPGRPPMWTSYVTVADVDGLVKKVEALGGKVHVPPMDIPNVGRFAVIQDPQGAVLNVITYVEMPS